MSLSPQNSIIGSLIFLHLTWVFSFASIVTTYCHLVAQSCPALCSPMNCSPPGSSVHGIHNYPPANWRQHTIHLQRQRYQHFTVGCHAKSLVYTLFSNAQILLWMKCYYCAHYRVEETEAYSDELVRLYSWKTVKRNQTHPTSLSTCSVLPFLLRILPSHQTWVFASQPESATRTPNCPLLLILVSGISHPHGYPGRRQRSLWISSCVSSPASCWQSSPLSSAS